MIADTFWMKPAPDPEPEVPTVQADPCSEAWIEWAALMASASPTTEDLFWEGVTPDGP